LFGFEDIGDQVLYVLRGDRFLMWGIGDRILGVEGAIAD